MTWLQETIKFLDTLFSIFLAPRLTPSPAPGNGIPLADGISLRSLQQAKVLSEPVAEISSATLANFAAQLIENSHSEKGSDHIEQKYAKAKERLAPLLSFGCSIGLIFSAMNIDAMPSKEFAIGRI